MRTHEENDAVRDAYSRTAKTMADLRSEIEANGALVEQLTGALRFILAFYEPGQTYLDTNAWTQAEASGRRALAAGEAAIRSLQAKP